MNVDVALSAIGAILCFSGWLALWLGSRMIGAVFGMGLGFVFGFAFALAMGLESGSRALVELGCSVMGAFGGVFLIRAINAYLLALVGFLFGILAARLGLEVYASATGTTYLLGTREAIIMAITGGVAAGLALWLRRLLAIFITAFVGTTFLCAGLAFLQATLPWSFGLLLLASIVAQSSLSSLFRRRKSRPARE